MLWGKSNTHSYTFSMIFDIKVYTCTVGTEQTGQYTNGHSQLDIKSLLAGITPLPTLAPVRFSKSKARQRGERKVKFIYKDASNAGSPEVPNSSGI